MWSSLMCNFLHYHLTVSWNRKFQVIEIYFMVGFHGTAPDKSELKCIVKVLPLLFLLRLYSVVVTGNYLWSPMSLWMTSERSKLQLVAFYFSQLLIEGFMTGLLAIYMKLIRINFLLSFLRYFSLDTYKSLVKQWNSGVIDKIFSTLNKWLD